MSGFFYYNMKEHIANWTSVAVICTLLFRHFPRIDSLIPAWAAFHCIVYRFLSCLPCWDRNYLLSVASQLANETENLEIACRHVYHLLWVCMLKLLLQLSRRLGNRAFLQSCSFHLPFSVVQSGEKEGWDLSLCSIDFSTVSCRLSVSEGCRREEWNLFKWIPSDLRICFSVSCECRNGFWCLEADLSHFSFQQLCLWFCSSQPSELYPAQRSPHSHCHELKFSRWFIVLAASFPLELC